MREQRMSKPCMQRFEKALTYEHVTVTRTHGHENMRDALMHACPSTQRNTQGHAKVLNLHVHAHTYSARVS